MKQLRTAVTLSTLLCLIVVTSAFRGCGGDEKRRNIAFARDIAGGLRAAAAIVEPRNAPLAGRMRQAANTSDTIVEAIEAGDTSNVAELIRTILPVFNDVVREFSNNENVLIALALAQIALNFFLNHYRAEPSVMAGAVDVIGEFKAQPQFGCRLRPEKCK